MELTASGAIFNPAWADGALALATFLPAQGMVLCLMTRVAKAAEAGIRRDMLFRAQRARRVLHKSRLAASHDKIKRPVKFDGPSAQPN